MKKSSTLLSCIGAVGVIGTAVSAAKATPKFIDICKDLETDAKPEKIEYLKAACKCYIPSALIGLSTIACIFGANGLNRRQQASLASAYMLVDNAYKEYKKKAKELYGKDSDIRIRKEIAEENLEELGDVLLFYDEYSGRYFERTMLEVLDAEYYLNRQFALEGQTTLNGFYHLLNLPLIEGGDVVGWFGDSAWIDFEHDLVTMDDGLECYILHISSTPGPA